MADAAVIRGPVGDWHALRANPDYKADWRAHGGAPEVVEMAGFGLRMQSEADLKAARWGLLAWEDPRERSKFSPFWVDERMLGASARNRAKTARSTAAGIAGSGSASDCRAQPSTASRPGSATRPA